MRRLSLPPIVSAFRVAAAVRAARAAVRSGAVVAAAMILAAQFAIAPGAQCARHVHGGEPNVAMEGAGHQHDAPAPTPNCDDHDAIAASCAPCVVARTSSARIVAPAPVHGAVAAVSMRVPATIARAPDTPPPRS